MKIEFSGIELNEALEEAFKACRGLPFGPQIIGNHIHISPRHIIGKDELTGQWYILRSSENYTSPSADKP